MIWCEPFCGSAAVGIRLLQKHGKPPISYMGSKQGFSDVILGILGLSSGQGCGGMVLGDVGPWAAVHATLGGAEGSAVEVARWAVASSWSFVQGDPSGFNKGAAYGHTIRSYDGRVDEVRPQTPDKIAARFESLAAEVAALIRSWRDEEPRALWERLKAEGWPSLLPTGEGRWLGPCDVGEVARWAVVCEGSFRVGVPESGYNKAKMEGASETEKFGKVRPLVEIIESRFGAKAPTFPPLACWQGQAQDMPLPDALDGWIIYMDPPYQNTSGYPHGDCPRVTVLALAADYSRRGAVVAISEAVPLDRDLPGWVSVRIDGERKGAKRTFSKQQSEYLTLNRKPAYTPSIQMGLF